MNLDQPEASWEADSMQEYSDDEPRDKDGMWTGGGGGGDKSSGSGKIKYKVGMRLVDVKTNEQVKVVELDTEDVTVHYGNGEVVTHSKAKASKLFKLTSFMGGEAFRVPVFEAIPLTESYDETSGEAVITVIAPGFNKSKGRYYPAETLKRDYNIFEGAKMFVDHATEAQAEARPEGSVHDWVASIKKVWAEADGRVRAKIAVFHEGFRGKLAALKKANLLSDLGVSIRAIGEASKREVEGVETNYVESLVSARSVDFVTFAGAGGMIEVLESEATATDVDLVTEAELRRRRPELVKLIESKSEDKALKTVEQQLQEAQDKLKAKETELTEANAKLVTAETAQKKTTAAAELTRLLSESKLPEAAKKKIQKQFAEATETKDMKEAIELETEYIKSIGAGVTVPRTPKNNGEADNQQESEGGEKDPEKQKKAIQESFTAMGMSKEAAEIAAAGRK